MVHHNANGLLSIFTFRLLSDIKSEPKRFTDMHTSCQNETTRSKKLKLLEECGFVKQEIMALSGDNHGKKHTYYIITDTGKKALELLEELKSICPGH